MTNRLNYPSVISIIGFLFLTASIATGANPTVAPEAFYQSGITRKISQLVGDTDFQFATPTENQTQTRYGMTGSDLGVPFVHNGLMYIAFGDTLGGLTGDRDPLAYTTDTDLEDGLALNFLANGSVWRPITIPGISQGAFNVPLDGVSVNNKMYLYHSADVMGRSVLAASTNNGMDFQLLYTVSRTNFINVSVNKVNLRDWPGFPQAEGEGLVIFGAGEYRLSSVRLAFQPVSGIENVSTLRYFTGLDGAGNPVWSANEASALELFNHPVVGEMSVAYNKFIRRWVMFYNGDGPRGINFRTAQQPWGPWSETQVLLEPTGGGAYGQYMHIPEGTFASDNVHNSGRATEWGGEYGPYMFREWATGTDNRTTIYFTMSTWNPYIPLLMKTELFVTNTPFITIHPSEQKVMSGESATFEMTASFVGSATFAWTRNGLPVVGGNSSTLVVPNVGPLDEGALFKCTVANAAGTATSREARLTVVSANQPPTPVIVTPMGGHTYGGGDVISFSGTATDSEDGSLPANAFHWRVTFHHGNHNVPFLATQSGVTSSSFSVPQRGESGTNVFFRIHLTVRDSGGRETTVFRDVVPRTAEITLRTDPPGQSLIFDGQTLVTPATVATVPGTFHTVSAPSSASTGGTNYDFGSWSDGGEINHTITTPEANTTLIANYRPPTVLIAAGSVWKYLVTSSAPSSSWKTTSFNDAIWSSGPGQLGYGDLDEATTIGWGADPNNRYVTTYFRKTFTVANPSTFTSLLIRLLRDDGGVVYLNGTEVFRSNLGGGAPLWKMLAPTAALPADEISTYYSTNALSSLLQTGANVIAVEIHQNTVDNLADLSFDFELRGADLDPRAPFITTSPASQTVATGSTVNFTVGVSGDESLGYQWRLNGENIVGATQSSFSKSNVQVSDSGNYSVFVTNSFGSALSRDAVLSVQNPPSITTHPASQSVAQAVNVTFSVAASGTPPFTYQWRFNGGDISGATGSSYTRNNVQSGDAGNYSVLVMNAVGSAPSANAVLTVSPTPAPPTITAQPQTVTLGAGDTATFTVSANGTLPMSYQWRKAGVNLANGGQVSGATAQTLALTGIGQSNAALYSVVITNAGGSITSANAELIVNDGNVEIVLVESRTTGGATGGITPNPPYFESSPTWSGSSGHSTAPGTTAGIGSRFSGSGTPAFQVTPTLGSAGGVYAVEATHISGNASPDIVISVNATGGSGLPSTTTVFRSTQGINVWANIGTLTLNPGTTTPTLTFTYSSGTLASTGGRFYADAVRFVNLGPIAPVITSQPLSRTNTAGTTATFTAIASGSGPLRYQWKKNGSPISGATMTTLTLSDVSANDAASYTMVVTNTVGTATTSPAVLSVNVPPSLTTQPASQTVNPGANVTFMVAASGTAPFSFQWRWGGTPISGATSSSYTRSNVSQSDAGNYSVVVTNVAGSVTSTNAVLSINVPPTLTTQPISQTVNPGANVTFAVEASGTAPFSYQWRLSETPISGATSSSYTRSNVSQSDAGNYSVVVTNVAGSVTSSNAVLSINVPPALTTQPTNQTVNPRANATFTVVASGTSPFSYQWRFNETPIASATDSSYTRTNISQSDVGNYSVVVANVAGTVTSTNAELTVNVPPTFTLQPESLTVDQGRSAVFQSAAEGTAPLAFQWQFNGADINGATNVSYILTNVQPAHVGHYSVVASNVAGVATSTNALLSINEDTNPPIVNITFPRSKQRLLENVHITNHVTTMTGIAADKVALARVEYSLNGSAFATASGLKNWQADLTLNPGINTVAVRSFDVAGNVSSTLYRSFTYVVLSPLIVEINGVGQIQNNLDGLALEVNKTYNMTAFVVTGTNSIFTNWTDSAATVVGTSNVLNFVMKSNLVLRANFIDNPFVPAAGIYNGLFSETNGVTHHSAGFFTLRITSKLLYSGKLFLDGDTIAFSGKFNLPGTALKVVSRSKQGKTDLRLTLVLDFAGSSEEIRGSVQNGVEWTADLLGDQSIWTTNTYQQAVFFTNNYTMSFPGFADVTQGPSGWGYGLININALGKIRFGGTLADGRQVGQATTISKDGRWPFYAPLYRTLSQVVTNAAVIKTNPEFQGSILGWLTFTANTPVGKTNLAPQGTVSWIKTGWTNALYSSGFSNTVEVLGSRHLLVAGERVIAMSDGTVNLSGGSLVEPFNANIFLNTNNVLSATLPLTNQLKISQSAKSGWFKGSFVHPDNNLVTPFAGALLQDYNMGRGFFIGPNAGGAVRLQP